MKKSRYFAELANTYESEIDDLLSDSEGKAVLQARLKEKRGAFKAIVPMIAFSPEMVAVAFYSAFTFKDAALMGRIALSEPGDPDFPAWRELEKSLLLADWSAPLIKATLEEEDGDAFLVSTATLEYLRTHDSASPAPAPSDTDREEDVRDDDEDAGDLAEAGNNWMAEQGFDSLEG